MSTDTGTGTGAETVTDRDLDEANGPVAGKRSHMAPALPGSGSYAGGSLRGHVTPSRVACALALLLGAGVVTAVALRDPAPPAFASDDFNRRAIGGNRWDVVDPVGDGTAITEGTWTADAWLRLSLPGGTEHSPWDENESLRIVQATRDGDFAAEVAFESSPGVNQSQGFLVEQDEDTWATFGIYNDGTAMRAQAATTTGSKTTSEVDEPIPAGSTYVLRIERDGDDWTLSTATDAGSSDVRTTAGTFSFPLRIARSGPYVGNTGEPAPPFTALVDYVIDTSRPPSSEDTFSTEKVYQLHTEVEGEGTVTRSPDRAGYGRGRSVTLTAEPADGWAFAGWSGDLAGTNNPTTLAMDQRRTIAARFVQDSAPPTIANLTVKPYQTTAVVRWTTDEPASSTVVAGTSPAYETGPSGTPYLTRDHAVTLTGLTPGTTYHYSVKSTDSAELTAATANATFETPATAGPAIDVWQGYDRVLGANGQPQRWANIGGKAIDPDGVASMSFRLNGGGARPLTVGPDQRRLQAEGDFNAEISFTDLRPGANEVVLTATDGAGQVSTATVVLHRGEGVPALPYQTDWASAGRIGDQAQVVDGKWGLDGSSIHILEMGYDRVVTLGDLSWHDYEVTVPVTVHEVGPGAGGPNSGPALIGMGLHWQGHSNLNGEQPSRHWYPTGALGWYRFYDDNPKFELRGNEDHPITRMEGLQMEFGHTYMFKARSETVPGGVKYSFKVWPESQVEPAAWGMTVVEDAGPTTGAVALIAHHVDAQFGDVTVTPAAPEQSTTTPQATTTAQPASATPPTTGAPAAP